MIINILLYMREVDLNIRLLQMGLPLRLVRHPEQLARHLLQVKIPMERELTLQVYPQALPVYQVSDYTITRT